jgi:hypothetical protein
MYKHNVQTGNKNKLQHKYFQNLQMLKLVIHQQTHYLLHFNFT